MSRRDVADIRRIIDDHTSTLEDTIKFLDTSMTGMVSDLLAAEEIDDPVEQMTELIDICAIGTIAALAGLSRLASSMMQEGQ
jgi:hypothetical protein